MKTESVAADPWQEMDDRWIVTFTGRRVHPLTPHPDHICIEDIAHALALMNRFNGHTRVPMSVAEHSVRVSRIVRPELALAALLHDAAEAYLPDVARPIKDALVFGFKKWKNPGEFKTWQLGFWQVERTLLDAIFTAVAPRLHDHTVADWNEINKADLIMLATEARDLMPPVDCEGMMPSNWPCFDGIKPLANLIEPWNWRFAKAEFLYRYNELTK